MFQKGLQLLLLIYKIHFQLLIPSNEEDFLYSYSQTFQVFWGKLKATINETNFYFKLSNETTYLSLRYIESNTGKSARQGNLLCIT